MKKGLVILIAFACISFTMQEPFIGTFHKGNDTHHFTIHADNTFEYKYVVDSFIDIVSEGTWKKIDKNKIVLNSYIEPMLLPFKVEKRPTLGSKRTRQLHITLEYDGDENDLIVVPSSNRNVFPSYNKSRGSQMLETAFGIDSIWFTIYKEPIINTRPKPKTYFGKQSLPPKYVVAETERVELKLLPGESAHVTIELGDENFIYRTFQNTPLGIKNNKLIFKDSQDGKTYELDKE